MEREPEHISLLISYELLGAMSSEQRKELDTWLAGAPVNREVYLRAKDDEKLAKDLHEYQNFDADIAWQRFEELNIRRPVKNYKKYRFFESSVLKWAAIFFIVFTITSIFYIANQIKPQAKLAVAEDSIEIIAPGRNGAILTLSSGQTVLLDTLTDGDIVLEGGVKATIINGKLQYNYQNQAIAFNTISTPKSRQYQLSLSDGTKVWLNAASSIRFPSAFSGSQRKVAVKGEVYFEVAPNKDMPFIVETEKEMEVRVLGTHFNISSYDDEDGIQTTLLEGAVQINYRNNVIGLNPGSQARVYPARSGSDIKLTKNVNLEKVIAWKNGLFHFDGADIGEVMKQLKRWYDIDVFYEGTIPRTRFFGGISRDETLNDVLLALEESGVHFKIEKGRRLIVLEK